MKKLNNFLLIMLLVAAGGASVHAMDVDEFQGQDVSEDTAVEFIFALSLAGVDEGDLCPEIIKNNTTISIEEWENMSPEERKEMLAILTISASDSGSSGGSPQEQDSPRPVSTTTTKMDFVYGGQKVVVHECVICLHKIENGNAMALTCGHVFHRGCIEEELKFRDKCPICKTKQDLVKEIEIASREKAGFENRWGELGQGVNNEECRVPSATLSGDNLSGANLCGSDFHEARFTYPNTDADYDSSDDDSEAIEIDSDD